MRKSRVLFLTVLVVALVGCSTFHASVKTTEYCDGKIISITEAKAGHRNFWHNRSWKVKSPTGWEFDAEVDNEGPTTTVNNFIDKAGPLTKAAAKGGL